jgi:hypothetical protein
VTAIKKANGEIYYLFTHLRFYSRFPMDDWDLQAPGGIALRSRNVPVTNPSELFKGADKFRRDGFRNDFKSH